MKKLALVIGGARGIGAAAARSLSRDGFAVAVADIDLAGARDVAAGLADATAHPCDVTSETSIVDLFRSIETSIGPITALVSTAGGAIMKLGVKPLIRDMELEDWVRMDAFNARGSFLCVREFFRARERAPVADGRIVLLTSMAPFSGTSPTGAAYAATKAATAALAKVAAVEGGPMGITVNALAPGTIATEAVMATLNAGQLATSAAASPLGRTGTPQEMGDVIAFLASPAASFVTGAVIHANGGRLMV